MSFPTPPHEDSCSADMAGFLSGLFSTNNTVPASGNMYSEAGPTATTGTSLAALETDNNTGGFTSLDPPVEDAMHLDEDDTANSTEHQPLPPQPQLTQAMVDADPGLKRLQQDLLVLTSIVDNSTLHWRPDWFIADAPYTDFWTLQNPPNVVTEYLPHASGHVPVATRRLRRDDDPPPRHIKDWPHWKRYCAMYGVPEHFLNVEQVELMRLGLAKPADGELCEPPQWPRYPEPQPYGKGSYPLDPDLYYNLPAVFANVGGETMLVVSSTGAIEIVEKESLFWHYSTWTHYSGTGGLVDDYWYAPDMNFRPKVQGKGRRWCYLPWTKSQESSCRRSLVVKLKVKVDFGGQ